MTPQDEQHQLEDATSRRLRKLAGMPVDTSRLDRLIEQQIPRPRAQSLWILRPLRAVAAGIAVLAMIGVLVYSLSGGPALASADVMAQMHNDVISGKHHVTMVSSIADASKALAMDLPVPMDHVMMCCMHSVEDKRVACVVLQSDGGVPVTMAVAKAGDMKMPKAQVISHNGLTYHVQSAGTLNMVMTERKGQWICLIGELESGRLMDIAGAIQF